MVRQQGRPGCAPACKITIPRALGGMDRSELDYSPDLEWLPRAMPQTESRFMPWFGNEYYIFVQASSFGKGYGNQTPRGPEGQLRVFLKKTKCVGTF